MKTIHEQNVFNKEIATIKKNQTEILKLNDTMTEWKNSTESFNKCPNHAEERFGKLEDKLFEISQLEEEKEKRNEKE